MKIRDRGKIVCLMWSFFFNSSIYKMTDKALFLIVYDRMPRSTMDVVNWSSMVEGIGDFVNRLKHVHEAVKSNIEAANLNYKSAVDKGRRERLFNVSNLCNGRFPAETYSKLKKRNFGPCQILHRINDNGYIVDLPRDFHMSASFNVSPSGGQS